MGSEGGVDGGDGGNILSSKAGAGAEMPVAEVRAICSKRGSNGEMVIRVQQVLGTHP